VLDLHDYTCLPGLIEMHAHLSKDYGEALGRIWLSYGITSVRNPAANAFESAEEKEAIGSGVRRGPRAVCVERLEGRAVRSLAMQLGSSLPMYAGAAPLALLAFLGGLFIPLSSYAEWVREIAYWSPMYGVAEVARAPLTHELPWYAVVNAVAWFLIFVAGAAWRMSKDTARV